MPKAAPKAAPATPAVIYIPVQMVAKQATVSVATIWRWSKDIPDFPKPKRIGLRSTRWNAAEVANWLAKGGAQ